MVEATNYVYLAILICLQYLGLQHESYEIMIDFSKMEEVEQRAPVSFDFSKTEDNENEWMIISPDKKDKVPLTIVKDSVIVSYRDMTKITKFKEINFNSLLKQQDTVFNKKQEPVATILRKEKVVEMKILDDSFYKKITITVNK